LHTTPTNGGTELILSVDGGATKTVALVLDEVQGSVRGLGMAGPTHLISVPASEVEHNLRTAVSEACGQAGVPSAELAAGLFGIAGIGDSDELTRTGHRLIADAMARDDFEGTNDGLPAYALAHLDQEGIAFAGGTGSVLFYRIRGEARRRGGWNWFVGDYGSASGIAKEALTVATREFDGILPERRLVAEVERYFGRSFRNAIALTEVHPDKRLVAGFAPTVARLARDGYGPAERIFEEAADYVVALIRAVEAEFPSPPPVAIIGGTTLSGDLYARKIRTRLGRDFRAYRGYQVAVGGLLLLLARLGRPTTPELRERMLVELENLLRRKDPKARSRHLMLEAD
jgi:N-acetylglucosamine kinase-like BadF-type ATPase